MLFFYKFNAFFEKVKTPQYFILIFNSNSKHPHVYI